jgi:hypothetical protein
MTRSLLLANFNTGTPLNGHAPDPSLTSLIASWSTVSPTLTRSTWALKSPAVQEPIAVGAGLPAGESRRGLVEVAAITSPRVKPTSAVPSTIPRWSL